MKSIIPPSSEADVKLWQFLKTVVKAWKLPPGMAGRFEWFFGTARGRGTAVDDSEKSSSEDECFFFAYAKPQYPTHWSGS